VPTQIIEWIAAWPGAILLQGSGTAYLFVNALHILGIGLLVGSILPLDLRLAGCFPKLPLQVIGPFLLRVASVGAATAILTGLWLFSVKPDEYIANAAFLWKMALLAVAAGNILLQHRSRAFRLAMAGGDIALSVRIRAAFSALLWLCVLLAGRWIGFL
jgi:hypothetical protein